MNKCKYCSSEIEEKTKSGKHRQFCNKSCSRKYVIATKPETVSAANKRGYQTTVEKHGEEFLKFRGRSTQEKKNALKKLNEEGHFHRMSEIGNVTRKKTGNTDEHVSRWRETYEKNGHTLTNATWKQFQRKCRRLTSKLYGSAKEGFHWDHIVPLLVGFQNGISPEIMCSEINIQKLPANENLKKGHSMTEEAEIILEKLCALEPIQSEQNCSDGSCAI